MMVLGVVHGHTVLGEQGVQEGTKQEIQDPVAEGGVQSQGP
jgi:hypothetical protein